MYFTIAFFEYDIIQSVQLIFNSTFIYRFQRPPGALPSSMLGFEALTGALDDFGFEDYLNCKYLI